MNKLYEMKKEKKIQRNQYRGGETRQIIILTLIIIIVVTLIVCGERKKIFQARKLNFLISLKESYERKLAAITASISKLEEQMNITNTSIES